MEKEMEHEMESGMIEGIIGIRGFPKFGVSFFGGPQNKDHTVVV